MTKLRSVAAAGLWCATALLLFHAGMRHFSASRVPPLFPQIGQALNVEAIEVNFGIDLPEGRLAWLLVVTSSCPACLALDSELALLRDAAVCAGVEFVPLIVAFGAPTDSMKIVLAKHGFVRTGESGPSGFDIVRVRSVPTLVEVDGTGVVRNVANPSISGSWPPTLTC